VLLIINKYADKSLPKNEKKSFLPIGHSRYHNPGKKEDCHDRLANNLIRVYDRKASGYDDDPQLPSHTRENCKHADHHCSINQPLIEFLSHRSVPLLTEFVGFAILGPLPPAAFFVLVSWSLQVELNPSFVHLPALQVIEQSILPQKSGYKQQAVGSVMISSLPRLLQDVPPNAESLSEFAVRCSCCFKFQIQGPRSSSL
jgi:hypothetical protein